MGACENGNEASGCINSRNFLTNCETISSSRRSLLHGVQFSLVYGIDICFYIFVYTYELYKCLIQLLYILSLKTTQKRSKRVVYFNGM